MYVYIYITNLVQCKYHLWANYIRQGLVPVHRLVYRCLDLTAYRNQHLCNTSFTLSYNCLALITPRQVECSKFSPGLDLNVNYSLPSNCAIIRVILRFC